MSIIIILLILFVIYVFYEIRKRHIHIWLGNYILSNIIKKPRANPNHPIHIVFCFVDHFEPMWNDADQETQERRINAWVKRYSKLALKFKDSEGKHPQHTFFYPEEEYKAEHIQKLAKLCKSGFGDVEIHLHHDNDTPSALRSKIENFKTKLRSHGLLAHDKKGKIQYGFIHGNWALDNSRKDGKWCGINNELTILKETGCYADFTLPSAPSDTQTKKINSLYYAEDNPEEPKSHNSGLDVEVGKKPCGDLMIIQGPLTLDWNNRKWDIFPRIENGKIDAGNPPTEKRVDLWIKQHIHVKGQPNWIFVKVYTHGCQEKNLDVLLGNPMEKMFSYLENRYNDGKTYKLHYVTAKQMYNIIKMIENQEIGIANET